jgi:hypothetical protein
MRRLAAALLERAFGSQRADSILGDLEEDLTGGAAPRWASRAAGVWLLWQAIAYVAKTRSTAEPHAMDRTRRRLEITTMWFDVRDAFLASALPRRSRPWRWSCWR